MADLDVPRRRLVSQALVGPRFTRARDAVHHLGAVQSQDFAGAKWALAQRAPGCTDAEVDRAFDAGEILRTHVLRPTWHFVTPEDLRWMLALSAPRVRAAMAPYDRELDLDEATFARSQEVIARALRGGGPMTRNELARVLAEAGIAAAGQRLGHIMMRAEIDAVVCSGPRKGKQHTYALVDARAPATTPRGRDEAVSALALRYFTSHGPARLRDFAWWSGLTLGDAKAGVAAAGGALVEEAIGDDSYWRAAAARAPRSRAHTIHLLPNFDEHLVAYRDHAQTFDASLLERTGQATGARATVLAKHVVVADGVVVGGWRRTLGAREVVLEVTLLCALDDGLARALRRASDAHGRFLGAPARLVTAVLPAKRERAR